MNVIGRCVFASDFNSLNSETGDVPLLYFAKKIFEMKLMSPTVIFARKYKTKLWSFKHFLEINLQFHSRIWPEFTNNSPIARLFKQTWMIISSKR